MNPIFIFGAQRSGTTFLGSMLGSHDSCLCIPEFPSKFLLHDVKKFEENPDDLLNRIKSDWRFRIWGMKIPANQASLAQYISSPGKMLEWLVEEYGRHEHKTGCRYWVDHTPSNLDYVDFLLETFPTARFVHLIRDGRAIFASTKKLGWGPGSAIQAASFWRDRIALGLAAESYLGPDKFLRIRYEDLILQPDAALTELCDFLSIDYQNSMKTGQGFNVPDYTKKQHQLVGVRPESSRMTGWKNDLPEREVEIFESYTGNLLKYLGYAPVYGRSASRPGFAEKLSGKIRDIYKYHFYEKTIIRKAKRKYR